MLKYTSMQGATAREPIAGLFAQFRHGSREAADQLVEILYPELRRIAASKMKGERSEHSWQPTVLVNELYLELLKVKSLRDPGDQEEKAAFMGFAGYLMNRLLALHARPQSKKAVKTEIEDGPNLACAGAETLAHVETVLCRLEAINPKFRMVVDLRVFEGYTGEAIAERLGCSRRTADRYWTFASHWLQKELAP
ncbi:MAG: ECF-type sigma factor [Acidobacteriota bacterium]|nr:ECF-type sigma factor [Acidobacteriota bacterium]